MHDEPDKNKELGHAGLCGTVAHSLLALVHSKTGPLPEFQPNDDLRRALSWLLGQDIHPAVAWLLLFVNGAVIWGFLFGQVYRLLPGKHPWQKGVFFGICVWIVMGFVFFPLVDAFPFYWRRRKWCARSGPRLAGNRTDRLAR